MVGGGLVVATAGRVAILALAVSILSPADFGRFVIWQSVVSLGAEVGRWGLPRAAFFLLHSDERGQPIAGIHQLILAGLLPTGVASIGAGIITAVLLARGPSGLSALAVFVVTALWVAGEAMRLPASESFRVNGKITKATLLGDAGRVVAGLVLLLVMSRVSANLTAIASATAAASVIVALVSVRLAWRDSKGAARSIPLSSIRSQSSPLLAISLVSVAQRQLIVLIAASVLSLSHTGTFTLLLRGSTIAGLVLQGLVAYVGPSIGVSRNPNQTHQLSLRLRQLTTRATIFSIGLGVVLFAVLPPLLLVLTNEPDSVTRLPLAVLLLGHVLNTATGPGGQVLVIGGHQRYVLRINTLSLLVLIASSFALAPLGLTGLALALSLASVFRSFAIAKVCVDRTGIRPWMASGLFEAPTDSVSQKR